MEVADTIVVLERGRIQQVGPPGELYERPANPFVMSFLGPVSRVGGRLLRPHDLTVHNEWVDGGVEALVSRIVQLGFEVRLDLVIADGEEATAQVARPDARELGLRAGDVVWIRPDGPALLPA